MFDLTPPSKETTDLRYRPGSLLPALALDRVRAFEEWLGEYWEAPVRLPEAYVNHLLRFHGGCPGNACFLTPAGKTRGVGRFFNFLEAGELRPLTPSWRQWSMHEDVRLDYALKSFLEEEFWRSRLGDAGLCLPIAGLDTAGQNCRDMDEMDLLCLDFNAPGEPAVAVWEADSIGDLEPVAPSFEVFLSLLSPGRGYFVESVMGNW